MRVLSQVFAIARCGRANEQPASIEGAEPITLPPRRGMPAKLDILVTPGPRPIAVYDPEQHCAVYLWGPASHETHREPEALLRWCAGESASDSPNGFRELLGNWVLMVDDRRRGEIRFASDFVGVRPWFVGRSGGRLIAGSDAWALRDAGLGSGEIDYDALSAWMRYNFDCTGGSLFADYRRLAPGAVSVYDTTGECVRIRPYTSVTVDNQRPSLDEVADALHERVRRTFSILTRDLSAITVPISGGFDSRYLLALAVRERGLGVTAVNVQSDLSESQTAMQIGRVLRHPIQVLAFDGHSLDLFDDPFPFSAGGFPTGRNIACAVADRHRGVPLASGYLGDVFLRGYADLCSGRREEEIAPGELATAMGVHHTLSTNRLDLFEPHIVRRIRERSLTPMRRLAEQSPALDRTFFHANLHSRQRHYIATIFLAHRDSAEAVLPFYSWDLYQYKMAHARECLTFETYARLFERHFPELARVPHNSVIKKQSPPRAKRVSRHLRSWGAALLRDLRPASDLLPIPRRRLLKCALSAMCGNPRRHDEVVFLYKVQSLLLRLKRAGIHLDWSRL
jgi:hypothetical protein